MKPLPTLLVCVFLAAGPAAAEAPKVVLARSHVEGTHPLIVPQGTDIWADYEIVIRSAAELVAHTAFAKDANNPEVQAVMTAWLADRFKVERIDWDKEMVVAVAGISFKTEIPGLIIDQKQPVVRVFKRTARCTGKSAMALFPRVEGKLKFTYLDYDYAPWASASGEPVAANSKEAPRTGPVRFTKPSEIVIRNAAELVARCGRPESANDPKLQQQYSQELARCLGVAEIDWSRFSVVGVRRDGGPGSSLELTSGYTGCILMRGHLVAASSDEVPRAYTTLALFHKISGEVKFEMFDAKSQSE